MEAKKYFKLMLVSIGALFFFTCFSIIYCIINSSSVAESQNSSHIMSVVYMIFHLLMEAIVFYYAFKAMVNGSSFIKMVMFEKDSIRNIKSRRNSLIFMLVSSIISIYLVIIIFPIDIFLSFFVIGLKFALLNFFLLVATIATFFYFFPKPKEND